MNGLDEPLRRLAGFWRGYWPASDLDGLARDVESRLSRAAEAWDLDDVRSLPGGNVALVCAASRNGRPVVLKLTPRGHPDDALLASEGRTLAFWRSVGAAIELLEQDDDGFTLLLEQARPGTPLLQSGLSWEEMLVELGRPARRLHTAGTPPSSIPPMSAHVESWPATLELAEMLRPSSEDVLVHLDLHPGNALRDGGEWKAIDPHGARADRHAEIWALICPEAPALPDDPAAARRVARHRLELYADAAGLDPERAAAWTRVRASAEASSPDGGQDPRWADRLRRAAMALSHVA